MNNVIMLKMQKNNFFSKSFCKYIQQIIDKFQIILHTFYFKPRKMHK